MLKCGFFRSAKKPLPKVKSLSAHYGVESVTVYVTRIVMSAVFVTADSRLFFVARQNSGCVTMTSLPPATALHRMLRAPIAPHVFEMLFDCVDGATRLM